MAEEHTSACETIFITLDETSEPRLPSGEIARELLDEFDLLWLDGISTHDAALPGLIAIIAAATASHLQIYTALPLPHNGVDVPLHHAETLTDAVCAFRSSAEPRTPRGSLERLQRHYARMAAIRSYDTAHPQDTLLLLTEEMGELAHALRNHLGIQRGHLARDLKVREELADIQLYILHMANITGTALGQAVVEKEELNHARWIAKRPTVLGEQTPRYLAIEGLIGAGKTTSATLAAASLKVEPTLERVTDHPFLERFYTDPERYAIEVELTFILMRWHALRDRMQSPVVVADYSPYKDVVFSEILLKGYDRDLVRSLYDHFWQRAPQPTLTVFLDVPAEVALARIKKRDRTFERSISLAYLKLLRGSYERNLEHLGEKVVVLHIDEDESREQIVHRIVEAAREHGIDPSWPASSQA